MKTSIGKMFGIGVVVILSVMAVIVFLASPQPDNEQRPQPTNAAQGFDPGPLKAVLESRRELDRTLWANEKLALAHEDTFTRLWDQLRAAGNMSTVLNRFDFRTIRLGTLVPKAPTHREFTRYAMEREPHDVTADEFRQWVAQWRSAGYRLLQSEWHHESFRLLDRQRHQSVIQVSLHLELEPDGDRVQITGPLRIQWSGLVTGGFPIPEQIDATELIVRKRSGPKLFVEKMRQPLEPITSEATYSDLIARDLNGDGLSEVAYPRTNLLLWNQGDGQYTAATLCEEPRHGITEGLLIDFTGDGISDFLCAAMNEQGTSRALFLYPGTSTINERIAFPGPAQQLTDFADMPSPDSVCAGDIDGDGDLDLFVTQYHAPFRDGKMPVPYDDANDGLPCYLLMNEGGSLRDVTEARGLGPKRHRRTYRSSLLDLDVDGDLDLLVVSDFSGVDLYLNDGQGMFQDATNGLLTQRSLFGMSHVVADFDNDAKLDLYVTGMSSTTARRLNSLGLFRSDVPDDQQRRADLAYGNRLYFGQSDRTGQRYTERDESHAVARAGWSWGCAALDANNDGFVDLYVANGHLSGKSAADYCTRFWCHDIYVGDQGGAGFTDLVRRNSILIGNDVSWNGYEKNRFFLNSADTRFESVGHLANLAIESDSRSVLADDFDGDGRVDLLVGYADRSTTTPHYVLKVFRNQWTSSHHWIGVVPTGVPDAELIGARVVVETNNGQRVDTIIIGESFATQQAPVVHFGLGSLPAVEAIEVHWVRGGTTRIESPAVDQYHTVSMR